MKRLLITLLIAVLAVPVYADDEHALPYDALIRSAKIYLGQKQKDYDMAEQRLKEAIANYEDPVEAHYYLGLIHSERAEYEEMIKNFNKVREICAKAVELNDKKLKKRCKQDKKIEMMDNIVLDEWEKAFASGVKNLKTSDSLKTELKKTSDDSTKAKLERMSGQLLDKAEEEFQVCLFLDDTKYQAWTNMGLVESRKGDNEAAVEHYFKSHELNPGDVQLLPDLANTLYKLGRYEDAVKYYDELAVKDSLNASWALTYVAICYQKLNNREKLKETFDRVIEVDPDDAQIHHQRGIYYIQEASSESLRDSLRTLDSLIDLRPRDKSLKQAKTDLLDYRLSFYHLAMPDFQKAVELDSTSADYRYWYATAAFFADDVETAKTVYESCVELDPDHTDCWCGLESVYAQLKMQAKYEEAKAKCAGE